MPRITSVRIPSIFSSHFGPFIFPHVQIIPSVQPSTRVITVISIVTGSADRIAGNFWMIKSISNVSLTIRASVLCILFLHRSPRLQAVCLLILSLSQILLQSQTLLLSQTLLQSQTLLLSVQHLNRISHLKQLRWIQLQWNLRRLRLPEQIRHIRKSLQKAWKVFRFLSTVPVPR